MEHPSFDRTLTKEDDFLGLKFNDVTKNYLYVWSYSVCTYSGRSTAFFSRESYSQPEYRKKGLLVTSYRAKGRPRDQIELFHGWLSVKHISILRIDS